MDRDPKNVDARRFAFDLAAQYGDPAEIARTDGPLLDRYLELGERDLARELINEVRRNWIASASARFLLRAGDFFAAEKDTADALAMYDRLVESHQGDPAALKALLKITDLRRETGDLKGALKAIELANRHPGCTPEWVEVFRLRRERLPA